jgi:hypothetical protein
MHFAMSQILREHICSSKQASQFRTFFVFILFIVIEFDDSRALRTLFTGMHISGLFTVVGGVHLS